LGYYYLVKYFRIVSDTSYEDVLFMEVEGGWMKFVPYHSSLYFNIKNINKIDDVTSKLPFIAYSYLWTVSKNKVKYLPIDILRADEARVLCQQIRSLPLDRFSKFLNTKAIKNCPIISKDVQWADDIYSKDVVLI